MMVFNENSKLLILGGTGHLGSSMTHYLVNELALKPGQIRIFYLRNSPVNALNDIDGLEMYPGNILNKEEVFEACMDRDYIFHMVGNTTFDPHQKEIQWRVNVEGTRNVLDACIQSKQLKRLCYTGTISTLGLPNPQGTIGNPSICNPYNENNLFSFKSAEHAIETADKLRSGELASINKEIGIGYLDSKLAAQELVNKYSREHDLDVVSILPGTMLGARDYLLGAGMYLVSVYNRQIPGYLKGGMSFMHVLDSVEGHLQGLKTGKKGSQYVITGKEEDNLYLKELFALIGEVIQSKNPSKKIKVPKLEVSLRFGLFIGTISELLSKLLNKSNPISRGAVKLGSKTTFYSYSEAEEKLGYRPRRTVRQALNEAYDYFEQEKLWNQTTRYLDRK